MHERLHGGPSQPKTCLLVLGVIEESLIGREEYSLRPRSQVASGAICYARSCEVPKCLFQRRGLLHLSAILPTVCGPAFAPLSREHTKYA